MVKRLYNDIGFYLKLIVLLILGLVILHYLYWVVFVGIPDGI